MKHSLYEIDPQLQDMVHLAHHVQSLDHGVRSGIAELDHLLSNSLTPGSVIEWGLPLGSWGRMIPLCFLKQIYGPFLWINSHSQLRVYPPSWESFGLNLKEAFFIHCDDPFELKPIFYEDVFKVLVIDTPHRISQDQMAYLALRARQNNQIIFVIRDKNLSVGLGNPFAKARLNVHYDIHTKSFKVESLKGHCTKDLIISSRRVFHAS